MNTLRDHETVIAAWLDDGPQTLPMDTRQAITVGVRTVTQKSPGIGWPVRGGSPRIDLRRLSLGLGGVAVVALAAVLTVNLFPNVTNLGGLAPDDPRRPFVGVWISTSDADGGTQTMRVRAAGDGVDIFVRDDIAVVCAMTPSTMTAIGRVDNEIYLVMPAPVYTCDDGTEPLGRGGSTLDEQLRDLTLVRDAQAGNLTDNFGGVWLRAGAPAPSPEPFDGPSRAPDTAAPPTSEPPTTGSPSVFTEIAPGEFVEIPDWPLGERTTPPMVWTGAELIVWGEGIYHSAGDGAAFDLADGTWRVIAEAPLSPRGEAAAAWTGTEMIVWGGRVGNSFYYDGAAYNPATDTWRLLPRAPGFFGKDPSMIWIGDEAIVFGVAGNSEATGEYIAAAAYDPVADSWRAIADLPVSVRADKGNVWWTGESIIAARVGSAPQSDGMARYDVATDSWTVVDVGASAAVVGVPESDGRVSTFVSLPYEKGASAQLIDGTGTLLAELPAFPGDPNAFGDQIQASGLWVGDEAVFEIWTYAPDYGSEQIWALNPSTQNWRRLDADTAFPRIDSSAVVVGDLLLMPNRPTDVYQGTPRACCVAPPSSGGSIYRISTNDMEVTP